jgi:hypothetical protein
VKRTWFALLVAVSLLPVIACDRTHLSPAFGVANRTAFKRQINDPRAGETVKPDQPLDPEESAIVSKTYLRSIAHSPSGEPVPHGGLLVVPPAQSGVPGAPPVAPMVPR